MEEQLVGTDNIDITISYNNLGYTYHELKQYDLAMEYYQKALTIQESKVGREHTLTANSYKNIGILHYDIQEYDKALEYVLTAMEISEKLKGVEDAETLAIYNIVANVYGALGDTASEEIYRAKAASNRVE